MAALWGDDDYSLAYRAGYSKGIIVGGFLVMAIFYLVS